MPANRTSAASGLPDSADHASRPRADGRFLRSDSRASLRVWSTELPFVRSVHNSLAHNPLTYRSSTTHSRRSSMHHAARETLHELLFALLHLGAQFFERLAQGFFGGRKHLAFLFAHVMLNVLHHLVEFAFERLTIGRHVAEFLDCFFHAFVFPARFGDKIFPVLIGLRLEGGIKYLFFDRGVDLKFTHDLVGQIQFVLPTGGFEIVEETVYTFMIRLQELDSMFAPGAFNMT